MEWIYSKRPMTWDRIWSNKRQSLGAWLRGVAELVYPHLHDGLCVLDERCSCFGCLLVNLRSDATYGEKAERAEALRRMVELRDTVNAHIEDVNTWEGPN